MTDFAAVDWSDPVQRKAAIAERWAQLSDRLERLESYLGALAECPCCQERVECLEDCTLAADCPREHEKMMEVRKILKETP